MEKNSKIIENIICYPSMKTSYKKKNQISTNFIGLLMSYIRLVSQYIIHYVVHNVYEKNMIVRR
jgi:hypothetical protein